MYLLSCVLTANLNLLARWLFFHLSSNSTPRSAFQNFPRLLFSLAKHTLQGILLLYQHLSKNISANADVAPPRLTAAHLLNLRDTTFSIAHVHWCISEHMNTFRRAPLWPPPIGGDVTAAIYFSFCEQNYSNRMNGYDKGPVIIKQPTMLCNLILRLLIYCVYNGICIILPVWVTIFGDMTFDLSI